MLPCTRVDHNHSASLHLQDACGDAEQSQGHGELIRRLLLLLHLQSAEGTGRDETI